MNRVTTVLVFGTVVLVLAAVFFRVSRINRLGGVPHSETTEACLQALRVDSHNPEMAGLLKSLGTNAMPTITNYLCYRESGMRRKMREWVNGRSWIKTQVLPEREFFGMALAGASRLKTIAGPFVIELFARQPLIYSDDSIARRADRVLKELGVDAVSALTNGLQSTDPSIWGHCALAIANHSSLHDIRLVPALADCASDEQAEVRAAAMLALGRVLDSPELSVPALVTGLRDDASAVRFHAAHSLWAFGSQAKSALSAFRDAIAKEAARKDEGTDQQPLGPKSRDMILYALTNAYATIREHGD